MAVPDSGPEDDEDLAEPGAKTAKTEEADETSPPAPFGEPGPPLSPHSPFFIGFTGAAGALLAFWLGQRVLVVGSSLILIVVAAFLAVGLNPLVEALVSRRVRRPWAVLAVISLVVAGLALFVVAIVPVITDQVTQLADKAPGWLDDLQHNRQVQKLDDEYQIIDKTKDYIANGDFASAAFGGVLGFGIAVLSTLANAFIITVLMLYFLASLPKTKEALYRLAPASRRNRVSGLGDQILTNVGSYVLGAFVVALTAGISSLIFLFIVGLGEYAVALAFVVALLDVIPMIGATLGAVVVIAIGFATDPKIGLACLIFYVVYQQFENYVIYPRVMSRSVDIPGSVIVIAALIGAGLLGVVGALLAIPTAAAILLVIREVLLPRQEAR
ncbi:AI-2E family transporter [Nocardioides sp.]|uniref:AI-2E family transporter n=1 Tax=Nocardioides sp. TaxID=35761 RepID=UPI003D0C5C12